MLSNTSDDVQMYYTWSPLSLFVPPYKFMLWTKPQLTFMICFNETFSRFSGLLNMVINYISSPFLYFCFLRELKYKKETGRWARKGAALYFTKHLALGLFLPPANEVAGRSCFHSCLSVYFLSTVGSHVAITHNVLDLTVWAPTPLDIRPRIPW